MPRFTIALLLASSLLYGVQRSTAEQANLTRPNIIVMMADDMGLGDSSAYQDFNGNSDGLQIHTPNMERLARLGVRFTDAHTPASRCTLTRYSLLTGRYSWRNRLKHWVLFGVQGDPMIEADRPTVGSMLKENGYRTGMVGKWHVGLRYRQSDGRPADAWNDADLTRPMFDTPLDHGFDYCRITSRSHATSGPGNKGKRNGPNQSSGPGHIHGRAVIGATGEGKKLVAAGPNAYVLSELGGRHLNNAMEFLDQHVAGEHSAAQPFFLYYAANSNHSPYTPDTVVNGVPVAGAAKNVAGHPMDVRSDFIHENDVVLGHLLDFLESHDDPRDPAHTLRENTIVIFTSDNGAERKEKSATGPLRSNKGSVYEGGHRVPFIAAWPAGKFGDGKPETAGRTDASLIGLQDLYATFAEIVSHPLPDLQDGRKGAEDSFSVLPALRGEEIENRPMFFNDHKEADDHAVVALRLDDPEVRGNTIRGQWKLFFDAQLVRRGVAKPVELFDLATDPGETTNRVAEAGLRPLVHHLTQVALDHRTAGGHRLVTNASPRRIVFDWSEGESPIFAGVELVRACDRFGAADAAEVTLTVADSLQPKLNITVVGKRNDGATADAFHLNARGLGIEGGRVGQVDGGESIEIHFDRDVIVESAALIAGNGTCGGYYSIEDGAPMAIYCIDADIDAQDQSGILSDIGFLPAGHRLRFDSRPHHGVEAEGQWRLAQLSVRPALHSKPQASPATPGSRSPREFPRGQRR